MDVIELKIMMKEARLRRLNINTSERGERI